MWTGLAEVILVYGTAVTIQPQTDTIWFETEYPVGKSKSHIAGMYTQTTTYGPLYKQLGCI